MDYTTIQIPKELAEEIDVFIEKGGKAYSSRAEFVKDAIRRRLEEINNKIKIDEINNLKEIILQLHPEVKLKTTNPSIVRDLVEKAKSSVQDP